LVVVGLAGGAVAGAVAESAPAPPARAALGAPGAGTAPQLSDVAASDLPGSGTDAEPYRISTVSGLEAMEDDLDANYVLTSDVDASATATANGGAGFAPVGNASGEFTGRFDGNGYTITGLTIDRPAAEDVGLFGETGAGAVIESVELANASVTGGNNVGGVAGDLSEGSVLRDVSGTVSVTATTDAGGLVGDVQSGSVVQSASVAGTVTGSDNIGGLVGSSVGGVVTRSSARATVTATGAEPGRESARTGGLVGGNYNGGVINRSHASGVVDGGRAGGITGENYNSSRVVATYAVGSVNGTAGQTGGVVGENVGGCPLRGCENFGPSTVTDSYWDVVATGQANSDGGTTQMQGSAAEGNMTGLDFESTWTTTDGYPSLRTSGDAEPTDPAPETALELVERDGRVGFQEVLGVIQGFNAGGTYSQDGRTIGVSFPDVLGVIGAFNEQQSRDGTAARVPEHAERAA
jgi:hypothetical protein